MDDYFDKFININYDEKKYRDAQFKIDVVKSKIESVERDIKRFTDRISETAKRMDGEI